MSPQFRIESLLSTPIARHARRASLPGPLGRCFPGLLSAVGLLVLGAVCGFATPAQAQLNFEGPPIHYETAPVDDRVARLQKGLDAGEETLDWSEGRGYLPSLLERLDISTASQVLVFSKTSFQLRRITKSRPRAVYFNDDCYVGYCQQGDVVELSAIDPQLGMVFYTLDQERTDKPQFIRDRGQCLTCHASSRTQGVPGGLVRSVFADAEGNPLLGSGTFTTDHRSPFKERWGGWFVSGEHGDLRHMGNVSSAGREAAKSFDYEPGANITDLSQLVDVRPYLTPHSDIVALMVLEHQLQMQNAMTWAAYEARTAAHYDLVMNEALARPNEHQSDSTKRRLAAAADKVVQHLLFSREFALTSPVRGTSGFAEEFQQVGPRTDDGRSLRDLDLTRRIFRYPCSYLILSPQFTALPESVKTLIEEKLRGVLTDADQSPEYAHLTAEDRQSLGTLLEKLRSEWSTTSRTAAVVPDAPGAASGGE